MSTRLRVDLLGSYHHIINRGVNRCDVFSSDDKEMFLQIINKDAVFKLEYLKTK